MLVSQILILVVGGMQFGTCILETAKKDTLQLVQVIFRHGDRAPTYTYPNDPYFKTSLHWPEGLAQLTNRGKMQQYELGQYLRHRYDGYLGEKYNKEELYVTSSDMDRTIMSLESNLAGLFPPVNHWNPKIEWQPIPLRTIPWKDDKFLHINVKCPRYNELRSKFYASDVVRRMNLENEDFIRYCAENSGLSATTVKELYPLLDVLYAQASHNFTLPKWAQGHTLSKLIQLYSVVNTWPTYTTEMKRLWGGPLLNLLIKNMQAIAGHLGSKPDDAHSISHGVNRKMLMYSAHDSTLVRIMNTMGVFEPHCPPYAAAFLVELHQDVETLEYYVELHYMNDTTRAPYVLTPTKCGSPCKLKTFIKVNQPVIPTDWIKECQLESSKHFFTLKMHEHEDDHHDQTDENYVLSSSNAFDWDPTHPTSSCSPSALQLVLMGIGLLAVSALTALVIVKVLKLQNGDADNKYYRNDNVGRVKSQLVGFMKNNPYTYHRSAYEQL